MAEQPAITDAFAVIRSNKHQHRQFRFRHCGTDRRGQLFVVQTHGIIVLIFLLRHVVTQAWGREFREALRDVALIRNMRRAAVQHHQERFIPVQLRLLNGRGQHHVGTHVRRRADLRIFPQVDIVDANPVTQPFQALGGDKRRLVALLFGIGENVSRLRLVGGVVVRLAQVVDQHRDRHPG
ncbi:hypothetical protein D3C76_1168830 [compost metagenome]